MAALKHLRAAPVVLITGVAVCGCSPNTAGVSPDSKTLASQSWTLEDGATLDARFIAIPVDEYFFMTRMVVEHTFNPQEQSPLESLRLRHTDIPSDSGTELSLMKTDQTNGMTIQIFELHLAVPGEFDVEFDLQKDGAQLQDPIPWTVSWGDGPE